jgi:hypothetical protein
LFAREKSKKKGSERVKRKRKEMLSGKKGSGW